MAITAKEALQQAREALGLNWTSNTDRDALSGIVDQLVGELATPLCTLQTVQLLWLSADASSRYKPVARRVLDKLVDPLPVLEQSAHAVAWAQVLAWSALRVGIDRNENDASLFIALMRSGSEWCVADDRKKRLWKELLTKAEMAYRLPVPSDHISYQSFAGWPNQAIAYPEKTQEEINDFVTAYNNAPAQIVVKIGGRINRNCEATGNVVQHIEKHLQQPLAAPVYVTEPLETLWWGQSLYSPSLDESYRDLNDAEKLFWMAEDMARLPSTYPSEARTAFFTETLRRVQDEIDKPVSIRHHAQNLVQGVQAGMKREPTAAVNGVPQQLHEAFEKDPTGLPITFIVEGARRKASEDAILSELQSKTGVDIARSVSTRQWARWVCRERLLVRFLDELVKE